MINIQRGVGMVEVMVALLLLAIGVLGFTALQLRAVSASMEAGNQVAALNIARDLTERMRANPQATQCKSYAIGQLTESESAVKCTNSVAQAQATIDLKNAYAQAKDQGMTMIVDTCPVTGSARQCVYVAWDKTAQSFSSSETCYKNGATSYERNATCIFLEAY